jgi:hypothetical protein
LVDAGLAGQVAAVIEIPTRGGAASRHSESGKR